MMQGIKNTSNDTFGRLMGNGLHYEVPKYQRDYSWDKDKDGNILDKPIKKNDHAVDALCYNCYGVRGSLSDYTPNSSIDLSEVHIY